MTPRTDETELLKAAYKWLAVGLLIVAAYLAGAVSAQGQTLRQPIEWPWNAVCKIHNWHGGMASSGSGTLIGVNGGHGLVLTCGHLFSEGVGRRVECAFPGGHTSTGRVLGYDLRTDLACIEIQRPSGVKPLLVRDLDQEDGPFTSCGYPGRYPGFRFVLGNIFGFYANGDARLDSRVWSGFSGGPLINKYGEVCGVTVTTGATSSSHVSGKTLLEFTGRWLQE